eukprot:3145829-Prymnesium_polylepis.1
MVDACITANTSSCCLLYAVASAVASAGKFFARWVAHGVTEGTAVPVYLGKRSADFGTGFRPNEND